MKWNGMNMEIGINGYYNHLDINDSDLKIHLVKRYNTQNSQRGTRKIANFKNIYP